MKKGRIILMGTLDLKSPMMIGSGSDELCDRDLLLDYNGEAFIPATSFVGVLQRQINADGKHDSYLGLCEKRGNPINQSYLICDDMYVQKGSSMRAIRDGIRIDAKKGTVEESAKYDYEVVEPGLSFGMRMEFIIHNQDRYSEACQLIAKIMGVLDFGIYIGGKQSSGFGRLEARDISVYQYDFDDARGLAAYLVRCESPEYKYEEVSAPEMKETAFEVEMDLKIPGSLIVRSYPKNAFGPDASHLKSAENYVLPATSLRGALRARAIRILNCIWKDTQKTKEMVESIFGGAHTGDDHYSVPSALHVDEAVIENVSAEVQNRVCIDRFTGGTVGAALFDSMPVFPKDDTSPNIRNLRLKMEDALPSQKGLLLLLLKDLYMADLPVGGEKNIGRGVLKGIRAAVTDQGKQVLITDDFGKIAEHEIFNSYLKALLEQADASVIRQNLSVFKPERSQK